MLQSNIHVQIASMKLIHCNY